MQHIVIVVVLLAKIVKCVTSAPLGGQFHASSLLQPVLTAYDEAFQRQYIPYIYGGEDAEKAPSWIGKSPIVHVVHNFTSTWSHIRAHAYTREYIPASVCA